MYASPFDANRFPDAPAIPDPDGISPEAVTVLHRLRSTLPDPVDWNGASPMEMSTALARAIFDHEAARLTLDLPDDQMDLPVALHQDDPRLLQLLDTARPMHLRDPSQWPLLMDMALEAVQTETADVMRLDGDGLQARDLDNQNLPLYETIHEDMLDYRLETRYQGILNPVTLAASRASPWMPPLPGTYRGVLPVRPSSMTGANPMPEAALQAASLPGDASASPVYPEQPQPQPQLAERSTAMPDYQTREVTDPGTQKKSYQTELNQVSQNLRAGSRIWGMDAENDTLNLRTFDSPEAAQAHIDTLQNMEPLRESLRNFEPVTVAGVPYDPVRDDDGNVYRFLARDGMDRTDLPWISTWELQQYAHTGTLSPELAVQQLQSAEDSGHIFTPFETLALQEFARDADTDPQFAAFRKQEGEYFAARGATRSSERNFSLDELPRTVRNYVQAHRFDLYDDRTQRSENREQRQEIPASARITETGLHLQDLHLPDINRQPMRVDAAFRNANFVRAFHNTPDALAFMVWINEQMDQRAALDRGEALTLGQLRYVPAGVPGEYRATNAETGQAIDRQIIDQSTLHDLLHDGVVHEDLAQQWQTQPELLATAMQTLIDHKRAGMYDYAAVTEQISRYAPGGIIDPSRMQTVAPAPTTEPAVIPTSAPGAGLALTAAERQAGSQQAAVAANPSQGMEGYQDEITQNVSPADSPAAMKPGDGNGKKTPVDQGKTQEAQQEGQEAQQDGQKAQQETQTANDGKNQKGQGQGQSANGPQQDATKAGGFSLFSRVHQHHHYQEPLAGAQPPAEAQPSAGANSAQDANPAPASGTNAPMQNAPQVSKRDTLGVMDMINQAPVSPEEINVMNNRVKREGLTPEIHDGIQNISARGQRDVKDQKLTPEQLQKNAHALNQLGDTVNNQPDSPQKKAIMEHIQKLGQMLMEAIKRIFSLGRASTGPSM